MSITRSTAYRDRLSAQALGLVEHLGSAAQRRNTAQKLAACVGEAERGDLGLQAHEVAGCEQGQDLGLLLAVDAQLGEELAVERGISKADNGAVEPGGVERCAQDLDDLGGPVRRRRADQLDPGLEELTRLPALGANRAVGAGVVEEAEGRLGGRVAVGDHACDRQRRVGAHRQDAALRVEEAVCGGDAGRAALCQDVVELDGGRRHLAVAEALEDLGQAALESAELAHLVGQDVP